MWDVVVGGAGGVSLAAVVAWVLVQFAQMRANRPGAVTDAATANQALVNSLEGLQEENARLRESNAELRQRVRSLEERLGNVETELRSTRRALHEATSNGQQT